ncbi:MAG: molybdopterin-dependent oxidoreductase [Candidatus Bathyarchaeota archaeon]|nr:molybdopterin-dependent oxidoreductase [Candidatus Bathyarchaeota archaeon]
MEIKNRKRVVQIIAASLVIMFLVIVGIAAFNSQNNQPPKLYPEEIREYQGADLSSIADFRENSIKGPQYVNESTYRLKITGLVNQTLEYSYEEILSKFKSYQKATTLHCVEGWSVTILWEGFLVNDLLRDAGVKSDAVGVIFYAYDGYSTELPLDYLTSHNILIAYKMNGLVLPPERGYPFQLVAESQYGYKWIKWVTTIEVTDNPNYLGYWESRGYPNNATLR